MLSKDENQERCEHVISSSELENEEPVQLVLSGVDTGISLVKVEFKTDLEGDEYIFSGFMTALNYIGDRMFPQPFDRMTFGRYTMLLRVESPFLFCYVFSGNTDQATRKLCEFIQLLEEKVPLLNSLKTTIATGIVDHAAKSSVKDFATRFFADSG